MFLQLRSSGVRAHTSNEEVQVSLLGPSRSIDCVFEELTEEGEVTVKAWWRGSKDVSEYLQEQLRFDSKEGEGGVGGNSEWKAF